jgi:NADH dehydrogenase
VDERIHRKKVLVLGGGYGGIKALEVLAGNDAVDVTLLDRNRYHFLQTESYNFIASNLSLREITLSLEELVRGLDPRFRFVQDESLGIEGKALVGRKGRYPFDYLIVATGSVTLIPSLFTTERLYGVKLLHNALRLKHSFETLLLRHMREETEGSSHIVVIGGGSSGVEIAAEMQHYLNGSSLYRGVRVVLVAEVFLGELEETSRERVREVLEKSGVAILEKAVVKVDDEALHFEEGSLPYAFGVLATGIAPENFVRSLPFGKERGFLKVDGYLRVTEGIYAVGDCALLKDRGGIPLPPTAQTAEQSGAQAAKNILREIAGEPLKKADLKIYGLAIALGGRFAIAITSYAKIDGILAHLGKKAIEKFYKIPLRLKSARGV